MRRVEADPDALVADRANDLAQLFDGAAALIAAARRIFQEQHRPSRRRGYERVEQRADVVESARSRLRAVASEMRVDVLDRAARGDVEIVGHQARALCAKRFI